MKPRSRSLIVFVSLTSLIFAALGDVFGNIVADFIPAEWHQYATLALAMNTFILFIIAIYLGSTQNDATDPHKRRSRRRLVINIMVIIFAECFSAIEGVIANTVAASLPSNFKPYSLGILIFGSVLVIGSSVELYRLQRSPTHAETNRTRFLNVLRDRYRLLEFNDLRQKELINLELTMYGQPAPKLGTEQSTIVGRSLSGMTIEQVYVTSHEHLLILGEPGAGKTTLLLELAIHLEKQARDDENQPVPVIFNLSTWGINRLPLNQWLVEDLGDSYHIPRKIAQTWIDDHIILPLLDGLDEVNENHRNDCVMVINNFYETHPDLPFVICSRVAEFHELSVTLPLSMKVLALPLTDEQIMRYLDKSDQLTALRTIVTTDADLREVLRTPLLLSIVAVTYEGLRQRAIPAITDLGAWRQQVFKDYVVLMLNRKHEGEQEIRYTPQQIKPWLIWLARQMRVHDQRTFHIEHIQMNWLTKTVPYKLYFSFIFGFVSFLLTFTANSIFFQDVFNGLKLGVIDAGLALILGWFFINGTFKKVRDPSDSASSSHRFSLGTFFRMISWKLVAVALIFGAIDLLAVRSVTIAAFASTHGLLVGVYFAIAGNFDNEIHSAELLKWSWSSVRDHVFTSMAQGLGFGTLLGSYNGFSYYNHDLHVFLSTLVFGISEGFVFGIWLTLLRGYSRKDLDDKMIIQPNQGIRNSLSNSFRLGFISGITIGPIIFFFYSYYVHNVIITGFTHVLPPHIDVIYGSVIGLIFVYLFWLINGGFDVLKHYTLRFTLWWQQTIPWRFISFLEFANQHILLSRNGGGYRFIHDLFLEYFAELEDDNGSFHDQPSL